MLSLFYIMCFIAFCCSIMYFFWGILLKDYDYKIIFSSLCCISVLLASLFLLIDYLINHLSFH